MPAPYPKEFREDVVRVAQNREAGTRLAQIAKDFGISESCLTNWMRQAEIEAGNTPGTTKAEAEELRAARRRIRLLEQENEVLRRAAAYLSQANLPKMMYPLVSELAGHGVPVAVSLRVLKLARQPYYRWREKPITASEVQQAYRANALHAAHHNDPEFGYRLLRDEAEAAGEPMAARTAWRLCHENHWHCAFGTRRGKNGRRPGPPVHDDHVQRQFATEAPNRLWLTDITEHPTGQGKLYLCAVKDVHAGRIVGYSMAGRMQASLAVDALQQAVARRGGTSVVAGCIVHSDRGTQFRSALFQDALSRYGLIGSMGQVGAAGDNAAMESFFALLQKNVLDRRDWATRDELRAGIITWIERAYHRRRRQDRLGRLTPIEYELIMDHTPA
ncbi:IS3 family transposase [Kocuria rhizophila]|uniref:IS3 family transposase n=1 Tax=Kocuria rhizophila TaxID=72000 RepID=UPI00190E08AE|nr:IS3 family transposase [Kocuria rhizophila]MBK4119643.1 IS3 family transposase [Kocuria rhizophila]